MPAPRVIDNIDNIVALGVGQDALAGEVLAAVGSPVLEVPVVVVRGGVLPHFVGERSLVVAVAGGAGAAPETVAAATDAVRRGAALVAVAAPGGLAEVAVGSGSELYRLEPGRGTREAPGAAIGAVLVACARAGLLPGASRMLEAAAHELAERRDSLLAPDGGLARTVAYRIGRTFPVVHGGEGIGVVAARRWADQVNMTAKSQAFSGSEPDRSAVAIAGFGQAGDVTRQIMTLVSLRSDFEEGHVAARFALAEEYASEAVASIVEVRAAGTDPLTQLLDLVLVGDFVALHLALAEGLDPGPVPVNDDVATRLAAGSAR
jgi:glucose/mannose-6-phosphate isomerase